MKSIYYFLEWHWKKYQYNHTDLVPIALGLTTISLIIASLGFKAIGVFILLFAILLIVFSLIMLALVEPIQRSYRAYKKEQRELLDKINFGQQDYERFRKR